MKADLHSHFLPRMDDGAETPSESLAILSYLAAHGIKTVAATPHYHYHVESVESFLERRERSFELLRSHLRETGVDEGTLPRLVPGAEVRIYRGMTECCDVSKLCYGNSRYILLEMPFVPFERYIIDEIDNIRYQYGLIPVIAHINRYLPYYSKKDMEQLVFGEGLIFQINGEAALLHRTSLRRMRGLVKSDAPFLFGFDIHDDRDSRGYGVEKFPSLFDGVSESRLCELAALENEVVSAF